MENYLNKSIFEIRSELMRVLREQIIAERMKYKLTEDIKATPSQVAEYYNSLPKNNLPLVDINYQIRQITIYPKLTAEEEQMTIDRLIEIRESIVSGERKFESMARMYSDDQMSAKSGGEIGFFARADLDPEFAAVAFSLEIGEISNIVKSQFGYHIIQVIERKGERINVRHILLKTNIPIEAKQKTLKYADSLRNLIVIDSNKFSTIAMEFSEDKNTKNNGGLLFNMASAKSKFTIDELPFYMKYDIAGMSEREISKPVETFDEVGNTVYKIYYLEKKIPQHVANLKDDYQLIYDMALSSQREKVFSQWIEKQQKSLYISIDKQYHDCNFKYKNWFK